MNDPTHKPFLHFLAVVGADLPADYISPPDDHKGNPTLDAVLFVPMGPNKPASMADEVHVHRNYKGDKWRCVKRVFRLGT